MASDEEAVGATDCSETDETDETTDETDETTDESSSERSIDAERDATGEQALSSPAAGVRKP
jgi:hypothetical protein